MKNGDRRMGIDEVAEGKRERRRRGSWGIEDLQMEEELGWKDIVGFVEGREGTVDR
jgi:hypothetical protein